MHADLCSMQRDFNEVLRALVEEMRRRVTE
jgi:hypothetical protein